MNFLLTQAAVAGPNLFLHGLLSLCCVSSPGSRDTTASGYNRRLIRLLQFYSESNHGVMENKDRNFSSVLALDDYSTVKEGLLNLARNAYINHK